MVRLLLLIPIVITLSVAPVASMGNSFGQRDPNAYTYEIMYKIDVFVDDYTKNYGAVPLSPQFIEENFKKLGVGKSFESIMHNKVEREPVVPKRILESLGVERLTNAAHKAWANNQIQKEINRKAAMLAHELYTTLSIEHINIVVLNLLLKYAADTARLDGLNLVLRHLKNYKWNDAQLAEHYKNRSFLKRWGDGLFYTSAAVTIFGTIFFTKELGQLMVKRSREKLMSGAERKALREADEAAQLAAKSRPDPADMSEGELAYHNLVETMGLSAKRKARVEKTAKTPLYTESEADGRQIMNQMLRQIGRDIPEDSVDNLTPQQTKTFFERIASGMTMGGIEGFELRKAFQYFFVIAGGTTGAATTYAGLRELHDTITETEMTIQNTEINPDDYAYKANIFDALASLLLECEVQGFLDGVFDPDFLASLDSQEEVFFHVGRGWNRLFLKVSARTIDNEFYIAPRKLPEEINIDKETGDITVEVGGWTSPTMLCPSKKDQEAPHFTSLTASMEKLEYLRSIIVKESKSYDESNQKAREEAAKAQEETLKAQAEQVLRSLGLNSDGTALQGGALQGESFQAAPKAEVKGE